MSADAHEADPFARPRLAGERVSAVSAQVAVVVSVVYVVWRGLFTVAGASSPASYVLFAAEMLAVVVFAARVRSAGATPIEVVVSPDAPIPDTAAVVHAGATSVDELRTTLVSLRRVEGVNRVFVVDPEGSDWLRTLAQRFDVTVVEPSVSFDEAVLGTGTNWVLVLRSGDLPMPDLVTVCAPRCSSPDVAVIQVGLEEADPTSFEHDPDGHWSLEPFEHQVVRPSLAARGSIPWFGDGPAMVRRAAIAAIEPGRRGNLLDDSRQVGLALIRAGLTVTHLPLTLARVRGPHGLGESLVRRHRRSRAALGALRPGHLAEIAPAARTAHLLALMPFVAALQRLLLVVTALLVLGLAQPPIDSAVLPLAVLAVPSYLLRWNTHLLLGRGRLRPFSILRSDLRSLGVDLLPFGEIRADSRRAGLSMAVAVVIALDAAILLAAIAMWRDWPDRLSAVTTATSLLISTGLLVAAMEVLLDAMARRQRRANHRVRLGLVTCRIEEHDGQLVDLSTGGAGVVVADADDTLEVGDVTTVSFRIPNADGAWKSVSALVRVAHRSADPSGGTRLGLSFDDPTDAPLDPVIEFLTIDRRLVALGRHEVVAN